MNLITEVFCVLKNRCLLKAVGAALILIPGVSSAGLFFSEYIEGSSNNKALEIFNAGATVDFAAEDYTVAIYTNGRTSPSRTIQLSGLLNPSDVFVLAHSRAISSIQSHADQQSSALSFNGDDAIALLHNGLIVDRIGQVGFDPGVEWGSGVNSTQNNTLVRVASLITGDSAAFDVFDPADQWLGHSIDSFSFLGSHSVAQLPNDLPNGSGSPVSPPVSVSNTSSLFFLGLGIVILSLIVTRTQSSQPAIS